MSPLNYIEAYFGIAVAVHYGTAYFYPETFKKFDGNHYPPWCLAALLWPITVLSWLYNPSVGLSKHLMDAGMKRKERLEAVRKRVAVVDDEKIVNLANEEVEQCLREKTL